MEGTKGVGVVKQWESCRVGATCCDKNGKDGMSKLPAPATKLEPGHGQVSVKGRERRETKGRERNETQVKERRDSGEREERDTERREADTWKKEGVTDTGKRVEGCAGER